MGEKSNSELFDICCLMLNDKVELEIYKIDVMNKNECEKSCYCLFF